MNIHPAILQAAAEGNSLEGFLIRATTQLCIDRLRGPAIGRCTPRR
jgi:hypothetical protein